MTPAATKQQDIPGPRRGAGLLAPAIARLLLLLLGVGLALASPAAQRFPPPEFETGHTLPPTTTPGPRGFTLEYLDLTVLLVCLGVASWLIYHRRSRKGLVWLGLFSLLYFGFWRKGCICAIGSVQNVAFGLADNGYALPLVALGFFLAPLAVAIFAGRSFCAGVCPHGALQDLVLVKPVSLPGWLQHGLGLIPFFYLGAGVLFAATGSAFIICQYDPFVPIFRMSGRSLMVLSGVALLVIGMFVGRPYCRFLCPYGALLKLGATVSKWRVRVTPDYCTQCRLCQSSCPFGAMREPSTGKTEAEEAPRDRRRLAVLLLLLPLLVALGAWVGFRFAIPAARLHPTVTLAERLVLDEDKAPPTGALSPDDLALDRARQNPQAFEETAAAIRQKFAIGTPIFGGWIGLVVGAKLISLSVRRRRTDYEPDRGDCYACARCFDYCPNELVRRGVVPPPAAPVEKVPANSPRPAT